MVHVIVLKKKRSLDLTQASHKGSGSKMIRTWKSRRISFHACFCVRFLWDLNFSLESGGVIENPIQRFVVYFYKKYFYQWISSLISVSLGSHFIPRVGDSRKITQDNEAQKNYRSTDYSHRHGRQDSPLGWPVSPSVPAAFPFRCWAPLLYPLTVRRLYFHSPKI